MRVEVKLYGDLKKYAPGDRNQFSLSLAPRATLEDIYRMLAIPKGHHVALINGRRSSSDAAVDDGDTLVLLPIIAGG
jgi:molybdopterin converting factor small subunit